MSLPRAELAGVRVAVTRPRQQADTLVTLIEAHGGSAIQLPTIEIRALHNPQLLHDLIDRLSEFDVAIFVSPIAVDKAMFAIRARCEWPQNLRVAAIGPSTAAALEAHGVKVDLIPATGFDSESLLGLPELRRVTGLRVVILRGVGGRELLAHTLATRGAMVEYGECYRRAKPRGGTARLFQPQQPVDIVTVSSVQGLQNLVAMTGPADRVRLLQLPMAVASQRVAHATRELNWQGDIVVAQGATDAALVSAMAQWHTSNPGGR